MRAEGMTLQAIADTLNEKGVPPPRRAAVASLERPGGRRLPEAEAMTPLPRGAAQPAALAVGSQPMKQLADGVWQLRGFPGRDQRLPRRGRADRRQPRGGRASAYSVN